MILTFSVLCLLFVGSLDGQVLPLNARKTLNDHFPGYRIESNSSFNKDGSRIAKHRRRLFKCRLNVDKIDDFAIGIEWVKDSIATESFVALIADRNGYVLHTLFSRKSPDTPEGELDFFIAPRGTHIANVGFEDEANKPGGQMDGRETFVTDCVTLIWRESVACLTYVFDKGRFREFRCGE